MRRDRLLEPLASARVAVVEAGAGYGKSVLAWQLRETLGIASAYVPLGRPDADPGVLSGSLHRALRAARLSDLAAATEAVDAPAWIDRLLDALAATPTEVVLVLDDAHYLGSAEAATALMRLARGLPAPHRLLVAARSLLEGPLRSLTTLEGSVRLDTGALAFQSDEAEQLLRSRLGRRASAHEVRVLLEATQGWATALIVAATAYSSNGEAKAARSPTGSNLIASSLRGIVGALDADDRRALIEIAHLPLLSPGLCEWVARGGSFERLVDAGVPLARTESGWWELPSPVSDYLVAQGPIAEATVRAAADLYAREGEVLTAIRVLLAAGLHGDAGAALARLAPSTVEDLGLAAVREIVDSLPAAALDAQPRVLLHVARVAEAAHQAELRTAALARATRVLRGGASGRDQELAREVDAELARDLLWDERSREEARALAARVLEQAGEHELIARARALDVLGRLASWFSATGPRPEAEALLSESAALARRVGQSTWAAQALVPLAIGYHLATCRYERALAVLAEALVDLPARRPARAMVQSFRAEVLVEVGRFAEAEACIVEMREIGRYCREEWILAYASWNEANVASYQGDGPRVVQAVLDAEQHRDVWYEQASGVEFLAQACDYLDRAGEHDLAHEYLCRAQRRMAGCERPVRVYGAAVIGRSGDPVEAEEVIGAALAGPAVEPQERWPLMLLRAYAAVRRADPEAGELAAAAFEECLELGHPDGPLLRERTVAEALLPLAVAAGSRAATALARRAGSLSIRVLGAFEVRRAGRVVELPAGRPAKAVRAVAAAGGRMHAEELTELLWPQTPVGLGRNRLRNLLSRLRTTSGELLVREQEMVALGPGCEVDAELFAAGVRSALAARSAGERLRAEVLARSALVRYQGELLPDDRYEGWASGPRERLRMQFLDLLDLLAAVAEHRGEVDEAVRLLDRAVEVEPYDERRYVQLALLLVSQGRAGTALGALRRARAALSELGIDPSIELLEVERTLHGRGTATRRPV